MIQHLAARYQQAPLAQKTCLLNECVSVTGYARKYALRLLNHPEEAKSQYQRPSRYGEAVLHALLAAWTAANHICAQRLMPFLPTLLDSSMREREAFHVSGELFWILSSDTSLDLNHKQLTGNTKCQLACFSNILDFV